MINMRFAEIPCVRVALMKLYRQKCFFYGIINHLYLEFKNKLRVMLILHYQAHLTDCKGMMDFDGCSKCSGSTRPVKHIKWYKTELSQIYLAWHVEKHSGGWPRCQLGTICLHSQRDYNQLSCENFLLQCQALCQCHISPLHLKMTRWPHVIQH